MYVMFPNYRPKFKEYSKLKKYARTKLRGKTKLDTLENIEKILDQLNVEVSDDLDLDNFAEEIFNITSVENEDFENSTLRQYYQLFADSIMNAEASPLVDYIKEEAGLNEVSGLEYVDSNNNSSQSLQNKIIELYKGLILHQSNINKIMTPLDHDFIKDDAQNLAPAKEKGDIDNFEFIQDILTKYSFLAGLTGVGQEANASSDYATGTMSDIYYENVNLLDRGHKGKTLSIEITTKNGDTKYIDVPHTKFDEIDSVPLREGELKDYVESYNSRVKDKSKHISYDEIKDLYAKIPISNSLTALMNAFVDIAKDPYITNINWNSLTTNTGNMLIRGGVHPLVVTSFLAQPIISEYIDFVATYETNNKSNQVLDSKTAFRVFKVGEKIKNNLIVLTNFSDGSTATINNKTLYEIVTRNEFDLEQLNSKSFTRKKVLDEIIELTGLPKNHSFTEQDLISIQEQVKDTIKTHSLYFKESENFNDFTINKPLKEIRENVFKTTDSFQANVFNTFLKFQGYAKKISASVEASKFGIKGYGKNSVSLLAALNKLNSIEDKGVKFYNTKFFYPDGTPKLLEYFRRYHLEGSRKIMQNNPLLFVSSTPFVWNTFNEISNDIYGTLMEDDSQNGLGDNLEKTFYTYLLSGFNPFNLDISTKEEIIKNFHKEFIDVKNKLKDQKFFILEQLQVRSKNEHKYIGITNKTNSKEYTDKMINSWREVLKHYPEFGKKLAQYSFLTSGFNPHTSSFYQFVPPSFFFQNNFNGYIKNYTKRFEDDNIDNNFIDHFYLANLDNSKFVKYVHPTKINNELSKKYGGGVKVLPNNINYRFIKIDKIFYKRIGINERGENLYSPYIKTKEGYSKIKSIISEIDLGYKIFNFNNDNVDLKSDLTPEQIEYLDKLHNSIIFKPALKEVEDLFEDNITVNNNIEVNRDYTETETTSTISEYEALDLGQNKTPEYTFEKEQEAAIEVENKNIPTGTIIRINEEGYDGLFKVINPENDSIEFIPLGEITPQQNQQLDLFKDGIDPFNEAPNKDEQNNCK